MGWFRYFTAKTIKVASTVVLRTVRKVEVLQNLNLRWTPETVEQTARRVLRDLPITDTLAIQDVLKLDPFLKNQVSTAVQHSLPMIGPVPSQTLLEYNFEERLYSLSMRDIKDDMVYFEALKVKLYRQLLKKDPQDTEALFGLATYLKSPYVNLQERDLYYTQYKCCKDWQSIFVAAVRAELYRRVLEIDPYHYQALYGLAECLAIGRCVPIELSDLDGTPLEGVGDARNAVNVDLLERHRSELVNALRTKAAELREGFSINETGYFTAFIAYTKAKAIYWRNDAECNLRLGQHPGCP